MYNHDQVFNILNYDDEIMVLNVSIALGIVAELYGHENKVAMFVHPSCTVIDSRCILISIIMSLGIYLTVTHVSRSQVIENNFQIEEMYQLVSICDL